MHDSLSCSRHGRVVVAIVILADTVALITNLRLQSGRELGAANVSSQHNSRMRFVNRLSTTSFPSSHTWYPALPLFWESKSRLALFLLFCCSFNLLFEPLGLFRYASPSTTLACWISSATRQIESSRDRTLEGVSIPWKESSCQTCRMAEVSYYGPDNAWARTEAGEVLCLVIQPHFAIQVAELVEPPASAFINPIPSFGNHNPSTFQTAKRLRPSTLVWLALGIAGVST